MMICSRKIKLILRRYLNILERLKRNCKHDIYVGFGSETLYSKLGEYVSIERYCNVMVSEIGRYTYLGEYCKLNNTKIGSFTSIGPNVKLAAGRHPLTMLSTSPYTYGKSDFFEVSLANSVLFDDEQTFIDEDRRFYCSIGNDVWIASNVTLVCGKTSLHIGDGAVIKAGAVVVKDVPPYAIVAGVPAKICGYRFEPETIKQLMELKWWDKDIEIIKDIISKYNQTSKLELDFN